MAEYDKTWDMKQSRLVDHTGCSPPCSYAEYQLATQPLEYQYEENVKNMKRFNYFLQAFNHAMENIAKNINKNQQEN